MTPCDPLILRFLCHGCGSFTPQWNQSCKSNQYSIRLNLTASLTHSKSLKVVELKDILAKASVSAPAKANKQDLIARIIASAVALDVYKKQSITHAPSSTTAKTSPSQSDDLVR
jgi:hypothetical protein